MPVVDKMRVDDADRADVAIKSDDGSASASDDVLRCFLPPAKDASAART